ncbi:MULTISPECIES: hypothetical protein [Cyanophyceae]|jgi:hypothetical protein|uniref:Uncharacterized protein n=3 Tax=Cyanophyceae TaxID=3028117 RepID=K9TX17_CHRTP|nr:MULTISPECIES: hypothetical protein [Cyanophyceae]PSB42645.1 hypothetical protein C7B80_26745 [Cyanosarcina cf. burmensis CCALA 770]AFY87120.1 hypothetical protein Chro_1598 [Chroococcidiopsis thermalis PCC 7203]MBD2306064.1 hypothetical protein [Chroococcidiopsis sp. [FACHB-1243]]MDZ4874446.1 hypothetical protein [Chroococcidiopsis cubana SAG 39.79]NHC36626.1 hypothetical protein [Scytonema millei VB511283]
MSITKRESGSAIVFEAHNGGVVAFCRQGACYVNPLCTSGVKSSVLSLMPKDVVLEELQTTSEFLELLAKK